MNDRTYNPQEIEQKWQENWKQKAIYHCEEDEKTPSYYCLDMFPYPSGSGLHVGHWRGYVMSDVWSRYKMLEGYNVLHPMGWDAFGLPAENAAIKKGIHPRESTTENIAKFKRQLREIGAAYNWEREINTSEPEYYKWTQWIFVQMYKEGLAYRQEMPINWCPDCKTGLANEEVIDGCCERCDSEITRKPLEQWMLKITDYADRLLEDLDKLDWPERTKKMQKSWIGRSEGTEVEFSLTEGLVEEIAETKGNGEKRDIDTIRVFTTRPDTLFGVTYLVLAPEHPLVDKIITAQENSSEGEKLTEIKYYVEQALAQTERNRKIETEEKTGVFTGYYCVNPVNEKKIPIWISDYVLMEYGTGAIMAVSAHDERDFAFARKFELPVKQVVIPEEIFNQMSEDKEVAQEISGKSVEVKEPYTGEGYLINSGSFSGQHSQDAQEAITQWLTEKGKARFTVNYKLRDWIFSRQRYWGEPIPIIYCEECGEQPVPEKDLPVTLPEVEKYQPTGTGESPLANIESWVNTECPYCGGQARRETNTMPQWAGSSWYFLRYAAPHNDKQPWAEKKVNYWLPVDFYVGGVEHAVLHLLYARFYTKFLYDIGEIDFDEPFRELFNQGMICKDGEKMSKSKSNSVSPDRIVNQYGADCLRLYEMFIGPPEKDADWDEEGIAGVYRFLNKMWKICLKSCQQDIEPREKVTEETHKLIKKVSQRIKDLKFNTVVSAFMSYSNFLAREAEGGLSRNNLEKVVTLLAPFVPHFAEEIWHRSGYEESIFQIGEWPDYDPALVQEETLEIPVQVNGRVRETLNIEKGQNKEAVVAAAEKLPKVKEYLGGREIKKIVFVSDRIVNFVLK